MCVHSLFFTPTFSSYKRKFSPSLFWSVTWSKTCGKFTQSLIKKPAPVFKKTTETRKNGLMPSLQICPPHFKKWGGFGRKSTTLASF